MITAVTYHSAGGLAGSRSGSDAKISASRGAG